MAFQLPFSFGSGSAAKPLDSRARQSKMMDYDKPLVWVVLLLMLLGMVMVYSASISLSDARKFAAYTNNYFVVRQALFIGISIIVAALVFRIRVATWQKMAPWLFIGGLALVVLTYLLVL